MGRAVLGREGRGGVGGVTTPLLLVEGLRAWTTGCVCVLGGDGVCGKKERRVERKMFLVQEEEKGTPTYSTLQRKRQLAMLLAPGTLVRRK